MGCCFKKSNKVSDVVVLGVVSKRKASEIVSEQPVKSRKSADLKKKENDQIQKWKKLVEDLNAEWTLKNYCLSTSRASFRNLEELVEFFRRVRAMFNTKDMELAHMSKDIGSLIM
jgi:hypothetical protein